MQNIGGRMRTIDRYLAFREYSITILKRSFIFVALAMGLCTRGEGQDAIVPSDPVGKGGLFLYWGYNRAGFSWSDIHFEGEGYDLTMRHVRASDRPVAFNFNTYFGPNTLWTPQYNYRLGWFFKDAWSISLGLDHMKYVVDQGQTVRMDGHWNAPGNLVNTIEDGTRQIVITEDILTYEHSDGLNLLSVDVDHYHKLWSSTSGKFQMHVFEGLHIGPVIPRSDVRLFGEGINNAFHVSGYGVGAQAGLHLTFLRSGFIRLVGKGGWIDLPDVLMTGSSSDRAGQHFWFYQGAFVVGARIGFGTKAAK